MDDVLVLIGADIQTNDLMEQVEGTASARRCSVGWSR